MNPEYNYRNASDLEVIVRIGSLARSHIVLCLSCTEQVSALNGLSYTALYADNIGSYGAQCHRCGITLVKAKAGWPELFTADGVDVALLTMPAAVVDAAIKAGISARKEVGYHLLKDGTRIRIFEAEVIR